MKFKIKRPPLEDKEPLLITQPCDCGDPDCNKILFAILHPQLKRLADTGETLYAAYMPIETVKGMIEWLEEQIGLKKSGGRIQ